MEPVRVPEALRDRLGRDATVGLLELLDMIRMSWNEQAMNLAVERFERRLTAETSALRVELHEQVAVVRRDLAEMRVELLRWSFVFWIGQVAATAALLAILLRGLTP